MTAVNEVVDLTVEAGVAVITLDYPPVNALSPQLVDGLYDALTAAIEDPAAQAILLICAGRTFIAGADLKSMGKAVSKVDFFVMQAALEDAPKLTVAALHGTALGGGLEVALTFHYRVAVPSARMGLPEVKLGLLPGGGGTQRLTRIVGPEPALDMLVSGRQVSAEEGLAFGLIDALAAEGRLREDALAFSRKLVDEGAPLKRVRDLKDAIGAVRPEIFAAARAKADREMRGQAAPQAIIRCVEAAVSLPFDEAIALERREFQPLLTGPQSAALRHLFMAERAAAKIAGLPADTPAAPVKRVGIVGGASAALAGAITAAGLEVATVDAQAADLGVLADCDLVIEAAPDLPSQRIEAAMRSDAVLALDPAKLEAGPVSGLTRPAQALGLHSLSAEQPLSGIEVVRDDQTGAAALATVMGLMKRLGAAAVVCKPAPGLIGERMLRVYREQADRLAAEGADRAEIDAALYAFGFPSGPFGGVADAGAAQSPFAGDPKLLERLIYPVVNEGARILQEGVAQRASDIDLVWVRAYGWPAYRGGPMFYADTVGCGAVLEALCATPGVQPAPLLEQLAEQGKGFSAG